MPDKNVPSSVWAEIKTLPISSFLSSMDFIGLNEVFANISKLNKISISLVNLNNSLLASCCWPNSKIDTNTHSTSRVIPITLEREHVANLLLSHHSLSVGNNTEFDIKNGLGETELLQHVKTIISITQEITKLSFSNARYRYGLEQTEQKVNQRTLELTLQNQILNLISQGSELKTILHNLVLQVEKLHPEMICSVLLLDEQNASLQLGAAPSLPDTYNEALNGVKIGQGVGSCGTAAFTGETTIVSDIETHPYWQDYQELAKLANVKSCWSEPIKNANGEVLGTFAIYHTEKNVPSDELLEKIKAFSNLAELAISRSLTSSQIFRLAFYDSLTGLGNRRLLEEHIQQALISNKRNHKYSGLMFIDLNDFKPVNDIYGHKTGDALLIEVGKRLINSVRATDSVIRFGGDEFIVLLRDIDADMNNAKQYMQRIARKISDELSRPYPLNKDVMYQCACSIGLVLFEYHAKSDDILRQADIAMYKAKRLGLNEPYWYQANEK